MSLKNRLMEVIGSEEFGDAEGHNGVDFNESELHEHNAEIHSELNDHSELHHEIDEIDTDIHQLEEKTEHLKENIDGLESMLNGTRAWNPELAQHYYNSASKITAQTFGTDSRRAIKGAESFSDKRTAKIELYAGMEDFKAKIKTIYEAIKAFIIKMYDKAIEVFQRIFTVIGRLRKKAEQVRKKVNDAEEISTDNIKPGKWNIYFDGKISNANKIVAAGFEALGDIKKCLSVQNADSIYVDTAKVLEGLSSAVSGTGKTTENTVTSKGSIAGVEFNVVYPTNMAAWSDKKAAAVNAASFNYKLVSDNITKSDKISKAASSKNGLLKLAAEFEEYIKKLEESQLDSKALKAAKEKTIGQLEESGDGAEDEIASLRNANSLLLKTSSSVTKLTAAVISAGLDYISASVD